MLEILGTVIRLTEIPWAKLLVSRLCVKFAKNLRREKEGAWGEFGAKKGSERKKPPVGLGLTGSL